MIYDDTAIAKRGSGPTTYTCVLDARRSSSADLYGPTGMRTWVRLDLCRTTDGRGTAVWGEGEAEK